MGYREEPETNYDNEDENDDWGYNYAQADHYIPEDEDVSDPNDHGGSSSPQTAPFLLLLKILLRPVEGWKSLRRSHYTQEKVQAECFYPLLALLACANFILLVYSQKITISQIIVKGVISFVSFFFGYYCILIFLQMVLPSSSRENFKNEFGKVFIIMSLSSLALFGIFLELLPFLWPVLIFLPLWTIYSMCRGIRFFKIPSGNLLRFTVFVCGSVISFPYLIDILLGYILPR